VIVKSGVMATALQDASVRASQTEFRASFWSTDVPALLILSSNPGEGEEEFENVYEIKTPLLDPLPAHSAGRGKEIGRARF
jgi:hypothetical protein